MTQPFHTIKVLHHVLEGDPGFVQGEEQDPDTAMRAAQALVIDAVKHNPLHSMNMIVTTKMRHSSFVCKDCKFSTAVKVSAKSHVII